LRGVAKTIVTRSIPLALRPICSFVTKPWPFSQRRCAAPVRPWCAAYSAKSSNPQARRSDPDSKLMPPHRGPRGEAGPAGKAPQIVGFRARKWHRFHRLDHRRTREAAHELASGGEAVAGESVLEP
jgi:hypothetical protein